MVTIRDIIISVFKAAALVIIPALLYAIFSEEKKTMGNFKIDMTKNSKELSNLYPTLSEEELEAIRVVYDSGRWNSGLWVRWRAVEYLIAEIIKIEREKIGGIK